MPLYERTNVFSAAVTHFQVIFFRRGDLLRTCVCDVCGHVLGKRWVEPNYISKTTFKGFFFKGLFFSFGAIRCEYFNLVFEWPLCFKASS